MITLERRGQARFDGDRSMVPVVVITTTHPALVEACVDTLRRLGCPPHVRWFSNGRGRRKSVAHVRVSGLHKVQRLLRRISPYLVATAAQARLVREWCDSRLAHPAPKGVPYTDEERQLIAAIRALNVRGIDRD
jgi:hypothetical protein